MSDERLGNILAAHAAAQAAGHLGSAAGAAAGQRLPSSKSHESEPAEPPAAARPRSGLGRTAAAAPLRGTGAVAGAQGHLVHSGSAQLLQGIVAPNGTASGRQVYPPTSGTGAGMGSAAAATARSAGVDPEASTALWEALAEFMMNRALDGSAGAGSSSSAAISRAVSTRGSGACHAALSAADDRRVQAMLAAMGIPVPSDGSMPTVRLVVSDAGRPMAAFVEEAGSSGPIALSGARVPAEVADGAAAAAPDTYMSSMSHSGGVTGAAGAPDTYMSAATPAGSVRSLTAGSVERQRSVSRQGATAAPGLGAAAGAAGQGHAHATAADTYHTPQSSLAYSLSRHSVSHGSLAASSVSRHSVSRHSATGDGTGQTGAGQVAQQLYQASVAVAAGAGAAAPHTAGGAAASTYASTMASDLASSATSTGTVRPQVDGTTGGDGTQGASSQAVSSQAEAEGSMPLGRGSVALGKDSAGDDDYEEEEDGDDEDQQFEDSISTVAHGAVGSSQDGAGGPAGPAGFPTGASGATTGDYQAAGTGPVGNGNGNPKPRSILKATSAYPSPAKAGGLQGPQGGLGRSTAMGHAGPSMPQRQPSAGPAVSMTFDHIEDYRAAGEYAGDWAGDDARDEMEGASDAGADAGSSGVYLQVQAGHAEGAGAGAGADTAPPEASVDYFADFPDPSVSQQLQYGVPGSGPGSAPPLGIGIGLRSAGPAVAQGLHQDLSTSGREAPASDGAEQNDDDHAGAGAGAAASASTGSAGSMVLGGIPRVRHTTMRSPSPGYAPPARGSSHGFRTAGAAASSSRTGTIGPPQASLSGAASTGHAEDEAMQNSSGSASKRKDGRPPFHRYRPSIEATASGRPAAGLRPAGGADTLSNTRRVSLLAGEQAHSDVHDDDVGMEDGPASAVFEDGEDDYGYGDVGDDGNADVYETTAGHDHGQQQVSLQQVSVVFDDDGGYGDAADDVEHDMADDGGGDDTGGASSPVLGGLPSVDGDDDNGEGTAQRQAYDDEDGQAADTTVDEAAGTAGAAAGVAAFRARTSSSGPAPNAASTRVTTSRPVFSLNVTDGSVVFDDDGGQQNQGDDDDGQSDGGEDGDDGLQDDQDTSAVLGAVDHGSSTADESMVLGQGQAQAYTASQRSSQPLGVDGAGAGLPIDGDDGHDDSEEGGQGYGYDGRDHGGAGGADDDDRVALPDSMHHSSMEQPDDDVAMLHHSATADSYEANADDGHGAGYEHGHGPGQAHAIGSQAMGAAHRPGGPRAALSPSLDGVMDLSQGSVERRAAHVAKKRRQQQEEQHHQAGQGRPASSAHAAVPANAGEANVVTFQLKAKPKAAQALAGPGSWTGAGAGAGAGASSLGARAPGAGAPGPALGPGLAAYTTPLNSDELQARAMRMGVAMLVNPNYKGNDRDIHMLGRMDPEDDWQVGRAPTALKPAAVASSSAEAPTPAVPVTGGAVMPIASAAVPASSAAMRVGPKQWLAAAEAPPSAAAAHAGPPRPCDPRDRAWEKSRSGMIASGYGARAAGPSSSSGQRQASGHGPSGQPGHRAQPPGRGRTIADVGLDTVMDEDDGPPRAGAGAGGIGVGAARPMAGLLPGMAGPASGQGNMPYSPSGAAAGLAGIAALQAGYARPTTEDLLAHARRLQKQKESKTAAQRQQHENRLAQREARGQTYLTKESAFGKANDLAAEQREAMAQKTIQRLAKAAAAAIVVPVGASAGAGAAGPVALAAEGRYHAGHDANNGPADEDGHATSAVLAAGVRQARASAGSSSTGSQSLDLLAPIPAFLRPSAGPRAQVQGRARAAVAGAGNRGANAVSAAVDMRAAGHDRSGAGHEGRRVGYMPAGGQDEHEDGDPTGGTYDHINGDGHGYSGYGYHDDGHVGQTGLGGQTGLDLNHPPDYGPQEDQLTPDDDGDVDGAGADAAVVRAGADGPHGNDDEGQDQDDSHTSTDLDDSSLGPSMEVMVASNGRRTIRQRDVERLGEYQQQQRKQYRLQPQRQEQAQHSDYAGAAGAGAAVGASAVPHAGQKRMRPVVSGWGGEQTQSSAVGSLLSHGMGATQQSADLVGGSAPGRIPSVESVPEVPGPTTAVAGSSGPQAAPPPPAAALARPPAARPPLPMLQPRNPMFGGLGVGMGVGLGMAVATGGSNGAAPRPAVAGRSGAGPRPAAPAPAAARSQGPQAARGPTGGMQRTIVGMFGRS